MIESYFIGNRSISAKKVTSSVKSLVGSEQCEDQVEATQWLNDERLQCPELEALFFEVDTSG